MKYWGYGLLPAGFRDHQATMDTIPWRTPQDGGLMVVSMILSHSFHPFPSLTIFRDQMIPIDSNFALKTP